MLRPRVLDEILERLELVGDAPVVDTDDVGGRLAQAVRLVGHLHDDPGAMLVELEERDLRIVLERLELRPAGQRQSRPEPSTSIDSSMVLIRPPALTA